MAETLYKLMLYGFFMVLFAGTYAILYAIGRFSGLPLLVRISYSFAIFQFLAGLGMVFSPYLDILWRAIILFSVFAYLFIPPVMWKVVVEMHRRHED